MPRIIPFVLCLLVGTTSQAMNSGEINSNPVEDARVGAAIWSPQIDIQSDCMVMQRYFDSEENTSASVIMQSFTTCQTGNIAGIMVNATFASTGQQGLSVNALIMSSEGDVLVNGSAQYQDGDSHLTFHFDEYDFLEDTEYTLRFAVQGQASLIYQAVGDAQYFEGTLTVNGEQVDQNLCFITLMQDSALTDHSEDEEDETDNNTGDTDTDEEDPHSDIHWGPQGIKPPLDREELRHLVYPNPFVQDFQIEIDTKAEVAGTVALYNFMGKKVFDQSVPNMADMKKMQVSPFEELTKGYYTLRIEYGDNIILDTVVKQ